MYVYFYSLPYNLDVALSYLPQQPKQHRQVKTPSLSIRPIDWQVKMKSKNFANGK